MEFVFRIGSYDTEGLAAELASALRRRTEDLSRQRMPGLWSVSDKLERKESGKQGSKAMGYLFLVFGIVLLVAGIARPKELLLPLIAGAAAVFAGLSRLLQAGTDRRFLRSAEMLLRGKETPSDPPQELRFSAIGMTLPQNVGSELVPYSAFETVVESERLLLLVFGGRVVVLQKRDLAEGSMDELRELLMSEIKAYLQ